MKKLLSFVLAIVFILVGVIGCSSKTPDTSSVTQEVKEETSTATKETEELKPIKLLWMNHTGQESERQWEDLMAKQFNEKNPNITVEIQRMSFDSYVSTLQTKIASGDAPDIFSVEGELMKTLFDNGYLADLSTETLVGNFNPADLELVTFDEKLIALPFAVGTMAAFYNKDVFASAGIDKVPSTLDEFYSDLEKLKASGVAPIANGYKESWCLMADMQADYITSILSKDPNSILDLTSRKTTWVGNELWIDQFERFTERYKYTSDDAFGTDWNAAQDMVATGKAAMVLNGGWSIGGIRGKNADVNMGVFAVPFTNNPEDTKLLVQAPSSGTAVYSGSKNLDAAIMFMEFMTSKDAGSKYAEMTNMISIVKGANAPSDPAFQDINAYVKSSMTFNQGAIDHNFPNEFRVAFESLVSKYILMDGMSIDELLSALDAEFDSIAASN